MSVTHASSPFEMFAASAANADAGKAAARTPGALTERRSTAGERTFTG